MAGAVRLADEDGHWRADLELSIYAFQDDKIQTPHSSVSFCRVKPLRQIQRFPEFLHVFGGRNKIVQLPFLNSSGCDRQNGSELILAQRLLFAGNPDGIAKGPNLRWKGVPDSGNFGASRSHNSNLPLTNC
jgi:hypothetical protein